MVTKEQLNEDQLASFDQMTLEAGFSEEKALELIQSSCIDKGYTGLRCKGVFKLSPEGRKAALDLLPKVSVVEPHSN